MKILSLFLALLSTLPAPATTWYVKATGGGTRYDAGTNPSGQCNGQSSSAYVSGVNQPCPYNDGRLLWNNPFAFNNAVWVMSSGDTVVLLDSGPTNQTRFSGSANASSGNFCFGIGTTCNPPDWPSNVTLQGVNAGSCSATLTAPNSTYTYQGGDPAKQSWIWGGSGAFYVLPFIATNTATASCIHITDHSNCGVNAVPAPGGASPSCSGTDYTSYGIYTGTAATPLNANITLTDVTIEGMQAKGIIGAIGGLWTLNRVGIGYNGQAGWDLDDGSAHFSTGSVVASYLAIYWNGCAQQNYPYSNTIPVEGLTCAGQSNGGSGDGLGTPVTPLNFSCDHCLGFNNVQDAFDLGHTFGSTIQITNSLFFANSGGTIKVGPNQSVIAYNNLIVGNGQRMSQAITGTPSNYNGNLGDFNRSGTVGGTNVQGNSAIIAGPPGSPATISSIGTAVTGVNTHFTTQLSNGDILIPDTSDPATWSRTVTIIDDTHLTLSSAWPGGSVGSTYGVKVNPSPASTSVIHRYHNSLAGYESSFWDDQCQVAGTLAGYAYQGQVNEALCPGYVIDDRDNLYAGYSTASLNAGATPVTWSEVQPSLENHNLCYNMRSSLCVGTGDVTSTPLLTSQPATPITAESQLDNYQFALTTSSPAKATGVTISGQTSDYLGNAWLSPPSMGALEFGSTPPPSSGVILNGTIQISGGVILQ